MNSNVMRDKHNANAFVRDLLPTLTPFCALLKTAILPSLWNTVVATRDGFRL